MKDNSNAYLVFVPYNELNRLKKNDDILKSVSISMKSYRFRVRENIEPMASLNELFMDIDKDMDDYSQS